MNSFRVIGILALVTLSLSVANATVQKPIEYTKMPTVEEFVLMSNAQRAEVIAAIREFYAKVEMRQPQSYGSEFQIKPLWQRLLFVEEAFAYRPGEGCVIAGYLSGVVKKGNWIGCPAPDMSQWWAKGLQDTYQCKPRTIVCNPLVFGYPTATGNAACTPISNTLTKDCEERADKKSTDEVAKDLLSKLVPSGKDLDPKSPEYLAAMNGLNELEVHCNGIGKSHKYGECGVLMARIAPIRAALVAAGNAANAKIAEMAPRICNISNSTTWAGIEIQKQDSGKYVVRAKPKSGENRVVELPNAPTSPVKIPAVGKDPGLAVTFDTDMKTCGVATDGAIAVVAAKPHDPCKDGAKEGWTEKCGFTDDRTVCSQKDEEVFNMTKVLGRTPKRKYGKQGIIGGGPEVQKMIKQDNVEFSVLPSGKLDDLFARDLKLSLNIPELAAASDFSNALKGLKDRCSVLNQRLEAQNKEGGKTQKKSNTFQLVRLKNKDSVMFTCQNLDKNYDPEKKLDANHLNFKGGRAVVIHQDPSNQGFVESGEIDEQGDFETSDIYRPGYRRPIAKRTAMEKAERADPKADQKNDKENVRYALTGLNLCPDTNDPQKNKVPGATSSKPHHKLYINKDGRRALCESADGIAFETAVGLTLDPKGRGEEVAVIGSDPNTDESRAYSLVPNKSNSSKCDLFWSGIQLPTSLKSQGSVGGGGSNGNGIKDK